MSFPDGGWASFPDFYDPNQPVGDETQENPPEGLLVPRGRFGRMWRFEPGVFEQLGWATTEERSFQAVVQDFPGGELLSTGDGEDLRVYLNDGTVAVYPDPERPRQL